MTRVFLLIATSLLLSCSGTKNKEEQAAKEGLESLMNDSSDGGDTIPAKPQFKYEIRKSLEGKFTKVSRGQIEQVLPKHIGGDGEGVYCYFLEKGGRIISLSLHIQYSKYNADLYELELDGEKLVYAANQTHTTSANQVIAEGSTFEWYDKMVNQQDEALIRKIGNAGKAVLRLKSKNNGSVLATIQLTKEECTSLLDAVDYYIALGGAKIPRKGMVNIRSF